MNGWIIAVAVVGLFIILAAIIALLCVFLTSGSSTPETPKPQANDARRNAQNPGRPDTKVPEKKMPTRREELVVPEAKNYVVYPVPDYYVSHPSMSVPPGGAPAGVSGKGNHSSNYNPTPPHKEQNTDRFYTASAHASTGRSSSARGSYNSEQSSSFEPLHYELRGRESSMNRRANTFVGAGLGAGNVTPFSDEISVMSSIESDYPSSRSVDVMSPRETIKK